ncbi:MAG: hypothetical protein HY716_16605 [Planctomycetes bacterium]|nr:hypothetical protein [Planctomycetota bacterium]
MNTQKDARQNPAESPIASGHGYFPDLKWLISHLKERFGHVLEWQDIVGLAFDHAARFHPLANKLDAIPEDRAQCFLFALKKIKEQAPGELNAAGFAPMFLTVPGLDRDGYTLERIKKWYESTLNPARDEATRYLMAGKSVDLSNRFHLIGKLWGELVRQSTPAGVLTFWRTMEDVVSSVTGRKKSRLSKTDPDVAAVLAELLVLCVRQPDKIKFRRGSDGRYYLGDRDLRDIVAKALQIPKRKVAGLTRRRFRRREQRIDDESIDAATGPTADSLEGLELLVHEEGRRALEAVVAARAARKTRSEAVRVVRQNLMPLLKGDLSIRQMGGQHKLNYDSLQKAYVEEKRQLALDPTVQDALLK